jgi:hypothetical protein
MKTKIIPITHYQLVSDDDDLKYIHVVNQSFERLIEIIADEKIFSHRKFRVVDWDNQKEVDYFEKVEKRFIRLLKYYLNPYKD